MQKTAFLEEDNTEVIYGYKEDDEVESGSNLWKKYYFEFNISKGEHMAIQLESESSKIIYHNATSSILNFNDHSATTVKPLKQGDVLGLVYFFWDGYLVGSFLHNGNVLGKGFTMKGKTVKPTIFKDPKTTVKTRLIFESPKKEEGTTLYK